MILMLLTSIIEQTKSVTHHDPSYETYQGLHLEHTDTLNCPCSEIKQSYSSFIRFSPSFHPVCSSSFVKDIWLDQLVFDRPSGGRAIPRTDWRSASHGYFQALAALCELANSTVNDALHIFGARTFVTTRLLDAVALYEETNYTLNIFIHNTQSEFGRLLSILRLLSQVDQYFSAVAITGGLIISDMTDDGQYQV